MNEKIKLYDASSPTNFGGSSRDSSSLPRSAATIFSKRRSGRLASFHAWKVMEVVRRRVLRDSDDSSCSSPKDGDYFLDAISILDLVHLLCNSGSMGGSRCSGRRRRQLGSPHSRLAMASMRR
jgi:hypothetical protein